MKFIFPLITAMMTLGSMAIEAQDLGPVLIDNITLEQEAIDVLHGFTPTVQFSQMKEILEIQHGTDLTDEEAARLIIENIQLEEIL